MIFSHRTLVAPRLMSNDEIGTRSFKYSELIIFNPDMSIFEYGNVLIMVPLPVCSWLISQVRDLMSTTQNAQVQPRLGAGDHFPVFSCPDTDDDMFEFYVDVVGKPVVMIFCGDKSLEQLTSSVMPVALFDPEIVQVATFVCASVPDAKAQKTAADWLFQTMSDANREITSALADMSGISAPVIYVLNPNQRICGIVGLDDTELDLKASLNALIQEASYIAPPAPVSRIAPVLLVPRVLEPEDCDWLIGLWREGDKHKGQVALGSAAKERDGVILDMKRREDYIVTDAEIEQRIVNRIMPRLVPEIEKILHFHQWGMEALRIGCYKAKDSGFFNVHRDNCNPSVQHRKYAITINLNTGDYEGGDLRFPEYGKELFQPPRGGAVVFSCSMLHEVLPVTAGERYTLLTFLTEPAPQ